MRRLNLVLFLRGNIFPVIMEYGNEDKEDDLGNPIVKEVLKGITFWEGSEVSFVC